MSPLNVATRGYLLGPACISTRGYICAALDGWREIIRFTVFITQKYFTRKEL